MQTGLPRAVQVHEQKARGVPDLVREGAISLGTGFVECNISAGRRLRGEREADRICAVLGNDLDGVDHVALGLRHLLAVGVAHKCVDVDGLEWHRLRERPWAAVRHRHVQHEVCAEHDHPGDPEEEDVEAGHQEGRGVEGGQVGGEVRHARVGVGIRPSEDSEGKQAGGEPGVEDVGGLGKVRRATCGARGWGLARYGDVLVLAMPRRDAVAPPELAGDAPVVDVRHPLEVGLRVHLRREADVAIAYGVDCRLRDGRACGLRPTRRGLSGTGSLRRRDRFVHRQEPLQRQARLDHGAGALRNRNRHAMILDRHEEPRSL